MTNDSASRVRVVMSVAVALVLVIPVEAGAHHDEFVNKTERGVTERVSISSSGQEGNSDSGPGTGPLNSGCGGGHSVSDDGRFVAFGSYAGNLHPADVNGQTIHDLFVYDRKKKELDLVSAMPSGLAPERPAAAEGDVSQCIVISYSPVISGNGRYVAFISNLPLTGTDEGAIDPATGTLFFRVFVRDLKKRTTEVVSRTWNHDPPNGYATGPPSISDSGRYVTFLSDATNMVKEDACPPREVVPGVAAPLSSLFCSQPYVRDRKKGVTRLVSKSSEAKPANRHSSHAPVISGNGRFVGFASYGDNLVQNDDNNTEDAFVHDLKTGETELVSIARDGTTANDISGVGAMSDNGRFVSFHSYATDLVPANPAGGLRPVNVCPYSGGYVRDRKTGRTERTSVTSMGTPTLGGEGIMGDDGRYVLAYSELRSMGSGRGESCDIVRYPVSGSHDHTRYAVHDRNTGQLDWVITTDHAFLRSADEGVSPKAILRQVTMSGNARFLVGHSGRSDVAPGDSNDANDVFVRDIGRRPLGLAPLGGSPPKNQKPPDDRICVAPGVCVPPQSAVSWRADDHPDQAVPKAGTELYGASLAYRPALGDLYAAIELEHMGPALTIGPTGLVAGGDPSLLYGLRFKVDDKSYEVRATSLLGGTFGLFDCTNACVKVAGLRGGYGTTGERVVISLPLRTIRLQAGGKLKDVEAFSAVGTFHTGATKILDRLELK